ncbi:hypothetical protein [Cyclobacterium marinum]|uniref:Uncharacterized protein n=1 Tax=Cyclobacterium marinum (strain ATCC 25205 / DSM 745 / LMG 13164 / NCIMB 1802) TaxID=880070 RepID=G0IWD4_CYCMS|nr:hypothetical protein [Cyclobacterium marinum]AEL27122.1 hypothetical protein Cycma_3399 [Cyclobacterium marinum DSM 745]
MHLKSDDIVRLEIDFITGEVPPPFCHIFKLKLSFSKNFVNTQFNIQYTDRETLTPEEIVDEGFTMADDYSYKGEIPKLWEDIFKKLYSSSKWSNLKTLGEKGGIKLLAKDIHGKLIRDIPLNQEDWYFTCQDFIQAIYEVSKKEAPMQIRYLEVKKEQKTMVEIVYKFSVRKVLLNINGKQKEIAWERGREIASLIFIPDYDYGLAIEDQPEKNGRYLDCGDGVWHNFEKGIINLDPSFDAKKKIQQALSELI